MKKKTIKVVSIIIGVIILLGALFIPFDKDMYLDGGTTTYNSLTYKYVKWNRMYGLKKETIYWFPNNMKSLDELYDLEIDEILPTSFSYKDDYENIILKEENVQNSQFNSINKNAIKDYKYAIDVAQAESDEFFDKIEVAKDDEEKVWRVSFYKQQEPEKIQMIYLKEDGKALFVVRK